MSALVSRSWIRSVIARAQLLVLSLVYTVSPRLGALLFRVKPDVSSRDDELRTSRQLLRAMTRNPHADERVEAHRSATNARGASYRTALYGSVDNSVAETQTQRQKQTAAEALEALHRISYQLATYRRQRKD